MIRFMLRAAFVTSLLTPQVLIAQDGRQDVPGQFDFCVLSLSWSPSFCASAAERARGRKPNAQCGVRPYSFVVHGLWPQYDKGFPEYCQLPAPRLDHRIVTSMLDLMPARHLVFNEWDRHGTCSGHAPISRRCAKPAPQLKFHPTMTISKSRSVLRRAALQTLSAGPVLVCREARSRSVVPTNA